jgi:hypothetical protein
MRRGCPGSGGGAGPAGAGCEMRGGGAGSSRGGEGARAMAREWTQTNRADLDRRHCAGGPAAAAPPGSRCGAARCRESLRSGPPDRRNTGTQDRGIGVRNRSGDRGRAARCAQRVQKGGARETGRTRRLSASPCLFPYLSISPSPVRQGRENRPRPASGIMNPFPLDLSQYLHTEIRKNEI